MKPPAYYNRIVDVMEELMRITVLMRPHAAQLVDRYSERKATGAAFQIRDHSAARLIANTCSSGCGR